MTTHLQFCSCGRALRTADEFRRTRCDRCRDADAVAALDDLTSDDDTEEDELADLTMPLCLYCNARLTEDDDAYCSVECADLARLRARR
jgi:hypothetical protein